MNDEYEDLPYELKRFEDLEPGEYLMGSGGPTQVLQKNEVHIPDSMYRLEFDNGLVLHTSGNHMFYVETVLDLQYHRSRVRDGKRLFKTMPIETVEDMEKIARLDEMVEVSLSDMMTICECDLFTERRSALERIAESIGPVGEDKTTVKDLYDDSEVDSSTVRTYDARRFCQQVLAFHSRKYRREWPILRGRVLTVEQMLDKSPHEIEFPTRNNKKNLFR